MSDNTKIWDVLARTDPKHTKPFKRAGGFSGTAVKPIYLSLKMTEQFGPCGIGWGMAQPKFDVVPCGEDIAVYCTVGLWHGKPDQLIYGVGGDFCLKQQTNRKFADDEAFKKAYTDALGNAMKQLGMSADVHMGQHEDDKYLRELREEFADEPEISAPEIAALNAINACNSRDEVLGLLNRDKDTLAALPNGGADRVRARANERLKVEFPKQKDAA